MKLLLIFLHVLLYIKTQPPFLNFLIAIQNQKQTYYSYLPYIDTCQYNQQYMMEGVLTIIPVTPTMIFNKLYQQQIISFWYPVYQGYDIAVGLNEQIQQLYSGFIVYNSQMQGLNRQIILYNVNSSGLTFNYTLINIDSQTMNLTFNIKSSIQINLTTQAKNILTDCNETGTTNFAFIGNQTFLFICSQNSNGFTFTPSQDSRIQIHNFSDLGEGNYSIVTNFQIFFLQEYSYFLNWECALLVTSSNQTSLYLVSYDNQTQNLTLININDIQNQTILILNRVWGQENRLQQSRWTEIYGSLNIQVGIQIPGDVVSIYVNEFQSIFIQSTAQQVNYLCIFNSKGSLYANFSFQGQVLFYGNQMIFIYNQQQKQIYIYEIQRPAVLLNAHQFGNTVPSSFTYLNKVIQCKWGNININYALLWSSMLYPAALISSLDQNTIYTDDSVFAFEISQKFSKVGPDFEIIAETGAGITAEVIRYTQIWLNDKGIGILNITTYGRQNFELIVVTSTSIYQIGTHNKSLAMVTQPCGFSDIVSAQIINNDNFLITNSQGFVCYCEPNFDICTLMNNTNQQMYENKQTSQNKNPFFAPTSTTNQTVLFKINLYQLIQKGYIISILQNNSVILFDINLKIILDTITMPCSAQNLTNGLIYKHEFFNPYLILFCEGETFLNQYIIMNQQLVLQRIVPLYGFQTRIGELSIQSTNTYIFLSVDAAIDVYPPIQSCCVLRINPIDDTTSMIMEVINASSIVATESYQKFDFVWLNVMTPTGQKSTIRTYIPEEWVILNLINTSSVITSNQVLTLSFNSPLYNFAAVFTLDIVFNLSSTNLSFLSSQNGSSKQNTINYTNISASEGITIFSSEIFYNFSQFVCGPIFNSYFTRMSSEQKNFRISQTYILKQNKFIGNAGIYFIQIIDPYKWNQPEDFTLNNLLIFVSSEMMYIYAKQIDNVQMIFISNFSLPEKSCTYYPYYIINKTAVVLTSNCQGIDFNFQTPFLTINYNNLTSNITTNYSMIGVPLSLRNINTIALNNSETMIIGILQGPMYTQTGRLVIVVNQTWSPLYISSSYSFLIDYSCFSSSINSSYFIMTVNPYIISIFINPVVQLDRACTIPNYTFLYTRQIQENYCSTIKILNATLQFSYIILSCSNYYYFLYLNFSTTKIQTIRKFTRYSQCALYDYDKPQEIFINNTLIAFFCQCRQNDYALKVSAYAQMTNPTSTNIYTGYLQVFMLSGPLGPNCSTSSTSPVRVVPISTSMNRALFLPYIFGNFYKLVYSQIEGIIIDNFLEIYPKLSISFEPCSVDYVFPQIKFSVYNEFHQQTQIIFTSTNTSNQTLNIQKIRAYAVFCLYLVVNLITIIFIFSYFSIKKQDDMNRLTILNDEVNDDGEIKYQDQTKNKVSYYNRHSINRPSINRKTMNYQLQLFFLKPSSKYND